MRLLKKNSRLCPYKLEWRPGKVKIALKQLDLIYWQYLRKRAQLLFQNSTVPNDSGRLFRPRRSASSPGWNIVFWTRDGWQERMFKDVGNGVVTARSEFRRMAKTCRKRWAIPMLLWSGALSNLTWLNAFLIRKIALPTSWVPPFVAKASCKAQGL